MTWNSQEKIKSAIPNKQNYASWLVKNSKTVFSKLIQKISLSAWSKQAVRQASTWPLVFLSQICRCFPAFKVVMLEYLVLFVLAKGLTDS